MSEVERSDRGAGLGGRGKLLVGGLLIVAAVIYLIVSSTQSTAQYYLTIEELLTRGESFRDRDIKVSGVVVGDSIQYDAKSLELRFTIVNVPGDLDEIERAGGLAQVLHRAVNDPSEPRLDVLHIGPMPDLLRHEAQAILTGRMGSDGVFQAEELLLKCPTRYEEEIPLQVEES
jgi:cytochrome c-type biogenesis protein CcmE